MTLGELIRRLEAADPAKVARVGITEPHSWRGSYMDLAFEPDLNVSVAAMLAAARSALGATYEGYKGGTYEMGEYTEVHISFEGDSEDHLLSLLLSYMLDEPFEPELLERIRQEREWRTKRG